MVQEFDDIVRRRQINAIKSEFEKKLSQTKDFPNCKDTYPDCPETPDKKKQMCKNCPIINDEDSEDMEKDELDE